MGFSAGGTVTASVAFNYTAESRPDFVAPIYAYMGAVKETSVPADAPPMFIAAASDDQLGLAPDSMRLYSKCLGAKKPVELHMYQRAVMVSECESRSCHLINGSIGSAMA